MYQVYFSDKTDKQLSKLDKPVKKRILAWIVKNLYNCEDPKVQGKALSGNFSGFWRYRVGDYRIIAEIVDDVVTIFIIDIDHRSSVYK